MRNKAFDFMVLISILFLISVDQISKLIVKGYYSLDIPIVRNILYFKPTLNIKYSWVNSLFNLGVSKAAHIIVVIAVIFLLYYIFKYIYEQCGSRASVDMLKVMLISGALCSLIDKLFWNGSLDFIYLNGFFVFDIKDCYITISQVLAIIIIFKNWTPISKVRGRYVLTGIISLIKKDFNIKTGE